MLRGLGASDGFLGLCCSSLRVQGSGFRVLGLGFRV